MPGANVGTANLDKSYMKNLFSRKFGGTREPSVADPFITGYAYVWFDVLPEKLPDYVEGLGKDEIQKTLSALCTSVTLPTATMNKATVPALGGHKWSAPSNFDIGDVVTLRFTELSGTPIMNIINGWYNMIRDLRMGASNLVGDDYTKRKYSAAILYWTTKPDGLTLEKCFYLSGLFPQKDPLDSFNFDMATSDKVDIDIDFNADNIYVGTKDSKSGGYQFIIEKCKKYGETIEKSRETILTWNGKTDTST